MYTPQTGPSPLRRAVHASPVTLRFVEEVTAAMTPCRVKPDTINKMETGTVHASNPTRQMIAIATGRNEFTIVKGDPKSFDIGDRIEWTNDSSLGPETYRNLTKGTSVSVDVQNHWVRPQQVKEQLLL